MMIEHVTLQLRNLTAGAERKPRNKNSNRSENDMAGPQPGEIVPTHWPSAMSQDSVPVLITIRSDALGVVAVDITDLNSGETINIPVGDNEALKRVIIELPEDVTDEQRADAIQAFAQHHIIVR